MSFKETDIKERTSRDHDFFDSDFCSGYTDVFGKWNTGFDCPRLGNGEVVYCCGTSTYKYCCTKRDQENESGLSQSVMLGSVLGSVLMIGIVILLSCFICRRCVPYRRPHPSLSGGPLYSMHCSSTASGMANMYSFSGQNTAVTTPLDAPHVLVDMDGTEHIYAQLNHQRGLGRQMLRNGLNPPLPSEPPPPYNERVPESDHSLGTSDLTTSFVTHASGGGTLPNPAISNQRRNDGDVITSSTANVYWSTKF